MAAHRDKLGTQLNEWYYIGSYGQLGPLSFDQIEDLVEGGVIEQGTYVWREGMGDWLPASSVNELRARLQKNSPTAPPPPPKPERGNVPNTGRPQPPAAPVLAPRPFAEPGVHGMAMNSMSYEMWVASAPPSDKNRIIAGLLNILPGFGRMYLGYGAHGVLQLMLAPCLVGWLWSLIDGFMILGGNVKFDGYGRRLMGS
jgi:hypothetical protein